MATRLRSRSSSLKNLPPESPGSQSNDLSVGGLVVSGSNSRSTGSSAAAHWTVNDKDKFAAPKPRPRQTVQLKHPKGAAASPNGSRPSSVGLGFADSSSNEALSERRSQARQLGDLPAPGQPRQGALSSRGPLASQRSREQAPQAGGAPASSSGSNPPLSEKLSSTAPPSLGGRPPTVPPRLPNSGDLAVGSPDALQKRRVPRAGHDAEAASPDASPSSSSTARAERFERERTKAVSPDASPSSPSTARVQRAKAPGAGDSDPDGIVYRPAAQVPPTPLPRGTHRQWVRPGSSSGAWNSRASTPNLSFSGTLSRPGTATATQAAADYISFEAEPPAAPRIAWSEGIPGEAAEVPAPSVLDMATQLRRDLLAFRLSEGGGEGAGAAAGGAKGEPAAAAAAPQAAAAAAEQRWSLSTPDAQRSFEEMERSLAKARQRGESSRKELGSYLDDLQARTFQPPPAIEAGAEAEAAEPLVAMPADFDDVVDLNAQLQVSQRGSASGSGAEAGRGGGGAAPSFALPSFLEKYFFEEKAVEQLPHRQIQDQEEKAKGSEETELQRGLRQIARLDGLLAKREAAGSARLKAAKVDFEASKDRLQRQADEEHRKKIATLQKLKEKGLMKGGSSASKDKGTPSTTASTVSSARSSVVESRSKLAVVEVPRSPQASNAMVEWGGWTSTAAHEEQPLPEPSGPPQPATPSRGPAEHHHDEPDGGTFLLTSMTGHLGDLAAPRRHQAARAAAEAARRASGHTPSSSSRPPSEAALALATIEETDSAAADGTTLVSIDEGEEGAEEAPPPAEFEGLYGDLESLEALRRIDEKLQRLVPEAEWEAKSICSAPRGSTADGSRARSVWSSDGGLPALPGDPDLRERAELREASQALQAIDGRLSQLQLEHLDPPEDRPPDPESLRKLLMRAAMETTPLDSKEKVMALTMQSFNGSIDDSTLNSSGLVGESSALVPVVAPHARLPDSVPLRQAREALDRLAGYDQEWEEANREADSAFQELEHEVRTLEETAASGEPPSGGAAAPTPALADGSLEPPDDGALEAAAAAEIATELDPFSQRLQELGAEVAALADVSGPSVELAAKLREENTQEAAARAAAGVALSAMGLPLLGAAMAVEEDDDDDELPELSDGEATNLTFAAPSSIEAAGGPSADLLRALDIELPAQDGLWDDAELERVVRAMDAHYGDQLPPMEFKEEEAASGVEEAEGEEGGDA